MNKDITIFTHKDLDGVISYLVFCWYIGYKVTYIATTPMKLEEDWHKWVSENSIKHKKIYFLDLDVTKIGTEIDLDNVAIFDHHKTNLFPFKNATTVIYNETSCSKLLYDQLFKKANKPLSNNQKTLIALADDWDSHTLATPISEELNIVYHGMNNKVQSFIEDYWNGFKPFDKFKINTIHLYKKHKDEYLKTLKCFVGNVMFDDVNVKVGAVFCNKFVQECCSFMFNKFDVEISIAVLLEQKRIAVRRNSNNESIDVSKFVQRIANGGGHEAAAGGNLTEEFIEFTKLLKPVTI